MKHAKKLHLPIAAALLLALLVSCQSGGGEKAPATGATDGRTEDLGDGAVFVADDLEDVDFQNRAFNFVTLSEVHWGLLDRVCVDEEIGESINDATYRRTMKVEERFDISIKDNKIPWNTVTGEIRKSINAGDRLYDAVYLWGNYFLDLAADGYLYDLNKLPKADFSKPYWDQNAKKDLSIAGRLYTMTGDANMFYNDATWVVMFNKNFVSDYGLEDPYQIVREGKWTMDKMMEMGKPCVKDLNSDGRYGIDDQYGMVTHSETIFGAFFASGEKMVEKDLGDIPVLNAGSERVIKTLEKVFELFNSDSFTYDVTNPRNLSEAGFDAIQKMFMADQALFCSEVLECVRRFREMETPFGLLPMPKLDESQDSYYSYIIYAFTGVCVPRDAEDFDFVGTVLEAMQSESHHTLVPAYFDSALYGKFFHDEESREMLGIILGNRSYPFCVIKDFGGLLGALKDNILSGKTEFVSAINSREEMVKSDIGKLADKIENMD